MGCPGDQRTAGGGVLLQKSLSLVHCRVSSILAPCSNVTATPATVFDSLQVFFTAKFIGRKNLETGVVLSIQITPRTSTDMNWTIAQTTKYINANQEELRRHSPLKRTGESMISGMAFSAVYFGRMVLLMQGQGGELRDAKEWGARTDQRSSSIHHRHLKST